MFSLDKITEYLNRPRESDDDYNETRALILTDLQGSMDEIESLKAEAEKLRKENDNLRVNNSMLYNRVESQILKHKEIPEDEPEEKLSIDDIVKNNRKLYEGVF